MKSKGANDNGSRRIMSLTEVMGSGLKILVSAVQSRPCPPLFSASCPLRNSPSVEFVPRFVPNSGTLQRIPAHGRELSTHSRSEPQDQHTGHGLIQRVRTRGRAFGEAFQVDVVQRTWQVRIAQW